MRDFLSCGCRGVLFVMGASPCLLSGCTSGGCNDAGAYGVVAFVVDGATGERVCSAFVSISDGAYTETLHMGAGGDGHACAYCGAIERPGTYALGVTAAGYQPAQQDNIVAGAGRCHVQTATVTVRLTH